MCLTLQQKGLIISVTNIVSIIFVFSVSFADSFTLQQCVKALKADPTQSFCSVEICSYRDCIASYANQIRYGDVVISGPKPTNIPAECSPHVQVMQNCIVEYLSQVADSVKDTQPSGIHIISATYGGNCKVAIGNVTSHIANQCNGKVKCNYTVDHKIIGDPAYLCAKTYTVQYQCNNDPTVYEESLSAEAGWGDKAVELKCR